MRFDCGTTSEDYAKINALRRWRGALDPHLAHELTVLAQTPGIPIEWLFHVFQIGPRKRERLRRMIAAENFAELAAVNAASVVRGDGLAMLALTPGYSGAAPLWAKLDLEADPRSDDEIAKALRVNRLKVLRWRRNVIFCPLTGVRLVGTRGTN